MPSTSFTDLRTEIAGIKLRNPVILASGPTGKDGESLQKVAKCGAGAVVTKTICLHKPTIPHPYMVKCGGGILNAEPWSQIGFKEWIQEEIKIAKEGGVPVIASISSPMSVPMSLSDRIAEIKKLAKAAVEAGADLIEIPGYDSTVVSEEVRGAREVVDVPLFAKLALSDFRIDSFAKAVEKAGATGITAIDSVGPCLAIDINTAQPVLRSLGGRGRLSGPSIKPLAVQCVATLSNITNLCVIGVGGIMNYADAIEMMMVGASAVEVCTAVILKGPKFIGELINGISLFMKQNGYKRIEEMRGIALKNLKTPAEEMKEVYLNQQMCSDCGLCQDTCLYHAIKSVNGKLFIDKMLCHRCGLCSSICPKKAIIIIS